TLKMLMAVFLICYAFYALFLEKDGPGGIDSRWGVLAGRLSTFFGSAFGFNGPPLAVYTAMSGWTADAAKGTLGACFILTGLAILSGQMAAGLQNT
ncbi:sulfite exporter TauE/SafE family protein, partial [Aduncisulcus paluster]